MDLQLGCVLVCVHVYLCVSLLMSVNDFVCLRVCTFVCSLSVCVVISVRVVEFVKCRERVNSTFCC